MEKILIIEDDYDIASLEKDYLTLNNYSIDIENDGYLGYQKALNGNYDLIILDLMLPSMSGLEICEKIRDILTCPIIMVTAKVTDIDKLKGFKNGATDYIEKPFSPSILVAKVKAHLDQIKRIKGKENEFIQSDNIMINIATHQVLKNNKEIFLKNKEFELLLFLMKNKNVVFSKEQLYEKIWGMDALGDNATITVHINRLRKKIEDDFSNPKHLCTICGVGYCFK